MPDSWSPPDVERRLAEMEATLGSMSEGLLICDATGLIIRANPGALRITGLSADELIGQWVMSDEWNRVPDGDDHTYGVGEGPLVRAIRDGEQCVDCPIEMTVRGSDRVFSLSAAPIVMANGSYDGAVAIIRDVTDERKAAQAREEFLSLLSHELRAPLTVISGYSQLLGRKLSRRGLTDELAYAQLIKEQASRMSAMASDLVELGRFEAGIGELKLEPMRINEAVEGVVARVRSEQRHSGSAHRFVVKVPADLPVIETDHRRHDQVLTNLLTNALKYSPQGGDVEITAQSEGNEIVIKVTDQGIGVPDEEKPRIFERAYRGPRARALAAQGLGLGLYICKLLIEAHGGRIGVADSPGGQGTCMWYTLPITQSMHASNGHSSAS